MTDDGSSPDWLAVDEATNKMSPVPAVVIPAPPLAADNTTISPKSVLSVILLSLVTSVCHKRLIATSLVKSLESVVESYAWVWIVISPSPVLMASRVFIAVHNSVIPSWADATILSAIINSSLTPSPVAFSCVIIPDWEYSVISDSAL